MLALSEALKADSPASGGPGQIAALGELGLDYDPPSLLRQSYAGEGVGATAPDPLPFGSHLSPLFAQQEPRG